MKSIDAAITPNYNRIRIGVGHPTGRGEEVVNHVLSGFNKVEKELLERDIEVIVATIGVLLEKGIDEYAGRLGMELKK